jgi:P-type Cu2+ transporter
MKTSTVEVGELVSTLSATGVFYPFPLSPELAALSMSGSSAFVAINALLLKRTRLAGIQPAKPQGAKTADAKLATGACA